MLKQVSVFPNPSINLGESGIPMYLPSSGTIGNNGALSGLTALPRILSGGCYMYFPANAISAGSAAGMYYVVMSSTTAGTIYNNTYTSGIPVIPTTPTPFSTTGPGAYTQTTGVGIPLFTLPIAGGVMGINGVLECHIYVSNIGNTNSKTMALSLGGATIQVVAQNIAANVSSEWETILQNCGRLNVQIGGPLGAVGFGAQQSPNLNFAIDTSITQNLVVTGALAVATDWTALESIEVTT